MINDLQDKIVKLKKKKNIAIVAHSYQSIEIQEIADLVGDSFMLSERVQHFKQNTIVLCGVRFMAETIKLLSPEKKVILANDAASCPMAKQLSVYEIKEFKNQNPNYSVVAYVNTTTELKAISDVCVTSSCAVKVVKNLDSNNILFIPDKNLGAMVQSKIPKKNFKFMDGCCPIHSIVTEKETINTMKKYPNYKLLCHPELSPKVCKYADFVGSTSEIINYAKTHNNNCIIGTEVNIAKKLSILYPNRHFPLLSNNLVCRNMAVTSLSDVYRAISKDDISEIEIPKGVANAARQSIKKMIELSV